MLSKKAHGKKLEDYRKRFYEGCAQRSVARPTIDRIWEMIESFSGYSFCKPHSASYALVPGRSGRVERRHVVRSRGARHVDAVAGEARDVVETARIPEPDRRSKPGVSTNALACDELQAVAICRELEPPAPSLVIDALHVEDQPHTAGRGHGRRAEATDDVRARGKRQPGDVIVGQRRRRRPEHAERDDCREHREGTEPQAAHDERRQAHGDAAEPQRPRQHRPARKQTSSIPA